MIRTHSHKQLALPDFDTPFETALDKKNRWVVMADIIPWDELAEGYYPALFTKRSFQRLTRTYFHQPLSRSTFVANNWLLLPSENRIVEEIEPAL